VRAQIYNKKFICFTQLIYLSVPGERRERGLLGLPPESSYNLPVRGIEKVATSNPKSYGVIEYGRAAEDSILTKVSILVRQYCRIRDIFDKSQTKGLITFSMGREDGIKGYLILADTWID
jgi:hypothetical protein